MTTHAVRSSSRRLAVDLAVYCGFAIFALITALASTYLTHQVWGAYATVGYLLGALHTLALMRPPPSAPRWWLSRWTGIAVTVVVGLVAPLVHLIGRRLSGGDWSDDSRAWGAQPEVWVIERSARLLLDTGTPYVDVTALRRAPEVDDYTPYGPVMTVFGLPRALVGKLGLDDAGIALAVTDARVIFIGVAVACVALSLRVLGRPAVPVAAAQLAVICPATALTFAVAAPDLAVIGLLLLSLALAVREHHWQSGVLLALVVSAKLTAAPAVLVLVVLIAARAGGRAAARFLGTLAVTTAAVTVPVALVDPAAFVEHVFAFPAGAGAVESPAASPLPGHLIASIGPAGHAVALTLLGLAALAITAWLVVRPPVTGADAALRIAVGLGTATLLTPATRWGYLVYPLVLLGARLCLPDDRPRERHAAAADRSTRHEASRE